MGRTIRRIADTLSGSITSIGLFTIYATLAVFIVIPVALVFYESFTGSEGFTLKYYTAFFEDAYLMRSFINSVLVAVATVATTSIIGVTMAYILVRYNLAWKNLLYTLATLPLIMPPFVGALAFKFLFGRHGTFNLILMDWGLIKEPINFIYGLHGVVFITTLHLFPLIMLNVMASLSKVDPSMEEMAQNLGAKGFRLFRTITLPLILPGFAAGALLVLLWSFSDLGTPLVIGQYDLLAPQAFFYVREIIDEDRIRIGIVMCVVMVALSTLALAAMRKYVSLRQYATQGVGVTPKAFFRHVGRVKKSLAYVFCGIVLGMSLLPHVGILLGSLGTVWSFTPFPSGYTLIHFKSVLIDTPMFLRNSLQYSIIATLLDLLLGAVIAYLLIRRQFLGKNLLDAMVMLPFTLPGIVIAIGYLRAFRNPIPFTGFDLLSTWMIIVIALTMRRLPYTVRASFAVLQQVHVSLEEASLNLGAGRLRTFMKITLPLMVNGLISGGILAFVNSITELSTSWLLSLPGRGWEPMTVGIMIYSQTGIFGQSAAMGMILIIIVAVGMAVVNELMSVRAGAVFSA